MNSTQFTRHGKMSLFYFSTPNSFFTLAKDKEKQKYNFDIFSEWNQHALRAYDSIFKEFVFGMKSVSRRLVFLKDTDGIVQNAEVMESAVSFPDFVMVKETLSSLS
jgi:peroxiredoxin